MGLRVCWVCGFVRFAVIVVCWVCYDGGLWLIIGGLQWWVCTLQ